MNNLQPNKEEVKDRFNGQWSEFYSRYVEVTSEAGQWRKARCPLHNDKEPSFSFNNTTGRFRCFGCNEKGDPFDFYGKLKGITSFPEVLQGIGSEFGINGSGPAKEKSGKIVQTYDYTSEDGSLLFQVVKFEPKEFRQRRPDGQGGWVWNMKGVRRVLYHEQEIITAETVLLLEGEKDVDRVRSLGFTATTNVGGAGKWSDSYSASLKGKDVVIIPDNDDPGRRHVQVVGKSLQGVARSVRVLDLPCLPEHGDVSDWLDAGGTAEELVRLIEEAVEFEASESENFSQHNELNETNEIIDLENRQWVEWPKLDQRALRGLARRFVELACANSEADPAAVLITFLARFAVEVGPGPRVRVGDSVHPARILAVIVGASSKARKGTSGKPVVRLFAFDLIQDEYFPARTSPGPLSSGEGLIYAVRDEVTIWKVDKKTGQGEMIVVDPGVTDKRLFILDEEFASVLIVSKREGNILSTIIRSMYDNGDLEPLTKANRIKASAAHIGTVSHITLGELSRKLEESEAFSGFANRQLWLCARRQGVVPFPEPMPDQELAHLQWELKRVIEAVRAFEVVSFSQEARSRWIEVYPDLSRDHSGLVGAVINRAEAQLVRLALIYALMDRSHVIEVDHLEAAHAVWRYCEDSARFIFAGREINPYADRIMSLLSDEGGKTTTQIYDHFSRNITRRQLEEALQDLMSQKKVEFETVKTEGPGRPSTIFKPISSFNSFNSLSQKEKQTDEAPEVIEI